MKLTLYPGEHAFVSREIIVKLNQGLNEVIIGDIPQHIDPHSLIFDFKNNLDVVAKTYHLQTNENGLGNVELLIEAEESKEYNMTFFYKVNMISYDIFYNFLYDSMNKCISMSGWVEINNYCGISFENVELQIVVNQNNDNVVFTLDNQYNIPDQSEMNVSFLFESNIPVKYKYIIPFDQNQVIECLFIKNNEESRLGTPLMPGNISLYFKDENQSLQHIGNDKVDIYLPDDDILFEIGQINDLLLISRQIFEETYTIDIQNVTDKIININLEINTYGRDIKQSNVEFDMDENGIGNIELKILPSSKQQVIYKIELS